MLTLWIVGARQADEFVCRPSIIQSGYKLLSGCLLTYAKAAEDFAQKLVAMETPRDCPERILRIA